MQNTNPTRRQDAALKERPTSCNHCGAVVVLRPNKNGLWNKFDISNELNPTWKPHVCAASGAKKQLRDAINGKGTARIKLGGIKIKK